MNRYILATCLLLLFGNPVNTQSSLMETNKYRNIIENSQKTIVEEKQHNFNTTLGDISVYSFNNATKALNFFSLRRKEYSNNLKQETLSIQLQIALQERCMEAIYSRGIKYTYYVTEYVHFNGIIDIECFSVTTDRHGFEKLVEINRIDFRGIK